MSEGGILFGQPSQNSEILNHQRFTTKQEMITIFLLLLLCVKDTAGWGGVDVYANFPVDVKELFQFTSPQLDKQM